MVKGVSPLLGYNTNVRHKGKLYHIQTEDSGVSHPHIITHLFADGGRIIASKKTSYAEHVGTDDMQATVKRMMQEQHKAMFIALRDGVYDEDAPAAGEEPPPPPPVPEGPPTEKRPMDVEALERAAARLTGASPASRESRGRYQPTRPAQPRGPVPEPKPAESIFGSDLLSEKSLDEVILSYLAEDLEEGEQG
ncbi:MAG: hypothetical protein ACODAU_09675 [Myxococcota bacterium]